MIKLNFLWRKLSFEQQDGQKISQVLTLWTVNTYFSHILAEIDEIHGKICDFYEIYGKTIILQLQNCSKPQGVICNVDETQTCGTMSLLCKIPRSAGEFQTPNPPVMGHHPHHYVTLYPCGNLFKVLRDKKCIYITKYCSTPLLLLLVNFKLDCIIIMPPKGSI